jgi:hypothetical protein
MLSLFELARKWFPLNAAGYTPEEPGEIAEREALNKRASEIWLTYHDNEPWARAKLAAGLNLTPEALQYMEREVTAREAAEAARKKNLETEYAPDVEIESAGQRERPGDGGRDREESGSGI